MEIIIYSRDSGDEKLKAVCFASHTPSGETMITFETQEWLPIRMGLTYHVKVGELEGRPAKFREIDVGRHPAIEPPYIYTVKLGPEWSGAVQMPESSDAGTDAQDAKTTPDSP